MYLQCQIPKIGKSSFPSLLRFKHVSCNSRRIKLNTMFSHHDWWTSNTNTLIEIKISWFERRYHEHDDEEYGASVLQCWERVVIGAWRSITVLLTVFTSAGMVHSVLISSVCEESFWRVVRVGFVKPGWKTWAKGPSGSLFQHPYFYLMGTDSLDMSMGLNAFRPAPLFLHKPPNPALHPFLVLGPFSFFLLDLFFA